jgi:hypothetical protein
MDSEVNKRRFGDAVSGRWKAALFGGSVFWLPDLAYHYFRRSEPTTTAIWVLTLVMPFVVTLAYFSVRSKAKTGPRSLAFSMLLGVWVLGPTMIVLGQTYQGAGFRSIYTLAAVVFATVFPPLTLIMAGYDLSIMALLLGTGALLLVRRICEQPGRTQTASGHVGGVAR